MSEETILKSQKNSLSSFQEEALTLGHLIKYNLYLLSKAVVFNALVNGASTGQTAEELADITHRVMGRFHRQDHIPTETPTENDGKVPVDKINRHDENDE